MAKRRRLTKRRTRKAEQPGPIEGTASAFWRPESVNEEERTAEVVFTTGADVERADIFTGDRHVERLIVSDDAVDLSRLNAGASLLDSHDLYSVRNQIGVVESARIEDGEGIALVRFSERADDIFQDVANGIIRKVSVGYQQNKRVITENEDGPDLHEITRWTPHELSFVTVPADNGAQVRTKEEIEIMDNDNTRDAAAPSDTGAASLTDTDHSADLSALRAIPAIMAPDKTEIVNRATAAERERAQYIADACTRANLPAELSAELLSSGDNIEVCKTRILDALIAQKGHEEIDSRIEPGDNSRQERFLQLVSDGLYARVNPSVKLDDEAKPFAHRPFLETARECLEVDGVRVSRGLSQSALATMVVSNINGSAMSTRAFIESSTLANVIALVSTRSMMKGYEAEPRTFLPIFVQSSSPNFRENQRIRLSDAPRLDLVPETTAITEGTLTDAKESYVVLRYGKILKFSIEMMINDDLSALSRIPQMLGAAASFTESDVFWTDLIVANGNLSDALAIFNLTSGNLVEATALDAAAIEAGRAFFRGQQTENGAAMGLVPSYLVVGPDLETAAEKLLRPPAPFNTATIADALPNSLASSLTLVVEPRVPAGSWYLFTDANRVDTAEYAWLSGASGVVLDRDTIFDSDAIRFKAVDTFGAGVLDRRGLYNVTA